MNADICIRVMLTMKQLLESKPLKSVRFFGKIFGRTKDYLICESEWKDGKEDEESKPPGPNKYTYWVINSRKFESQQICPLITLIQLEKNGSDFHTQNLQMS